MSETGQRPRDPKYYVRTGEGTDALGIALDSWDQRGGWTGLSIFRLSYGDSEDEQKKINERAQALVEAANRGLSQSAELTRLQQSNAALVEALKGMLEPYGNVPAEKPYFTGAAAERIKAARDALATSN